MRILCVDDDIFLLRILQHCLGKWQVVVASDAAGARAILAQAPVDVVLTDVHMPGEDGWSLAHFVWQTYPQVRLFIMSSVERPGDLPTYVQGFIQKPFECRWVKEVLEDGLVHA